MADIIMRKFWLSFRAQFNKLANFFWTRDPIAQMQLEYDQSVAQLKEGREGLEQYRALVERVTRQVKSAEKKIETLTAKIKAYLGAGDRNTAGQLAIELERAKEELAENREQLAMHEAAYGNNLEKIKHAAKNLHKVQDKIRRYEAELKMSQAEAEMAKLSQSFEFDVTTDFGELEQVVQDKIDRNRAATRVAADLSGRGMEEIRAEQAMEQAMADELLDRFEVEMGMKTPETADIKPQKAPLGPEKVSVKKKG